MCWGLKEVDFGMIFGFWFWFGKKNCSRKGGFRRKVFDGFGIVKKGFW